MTGLFAAPSVTLTPSPGLSHVLSCDEGPIGWARHSDGPQGFTLRKLLLFIDKQATSAAQFVVEDTHGTPHYAVFKSQGSAGGFTMQVVDAEQRLVGSATVESRYLPGRTIADVSITDGSGTPVAHMSTTHIPQVHDLQGRPIASWRQRSEGGLLSSTVSTLVEFEAEDLPEWMRALIVGLVLCRDLSY